MNHKVRAISLLLILMFAAFVQARTGQQEVKPNDATISLSEAQTQALQTIRRENEKRIAPVALRFAQTIKQIYDNMLADKPDDALGQRLAKEMNAVAAELFAIRGQAFREAIKILTPEQKEVLKRARMKPDAPADLLDLIAQTFHVPEK